MAKTFQDPMEIWVSEQHLQLAWYTIRQRGHPGERIRLVFPNQSFGMSRHLSHGTLRRVMESQVSAMRVLLSRLDPHASSCRSPCHPEELNGKQNWCSIAY